MIRKLKSQAGETMAEVLIASLIAVLGVTLFAMMVSASFHVIVSSDTKMADYYAVENNAEGQEVPFKQNVPLIITINGVDSSTVTGITRPNDINGVVSTVYGNDKVMSYKFIGD